MIPIRRFYHALADWLNAQDHREGCGFGTVVQDGPLEGNKIPCSCGRTELQNVTNEVRDEL